MNFQFFKLLQSYDEKKTLWGSDSTPPLDWIGVNQLWICSTTFWINFGGKRSKNAPPPPRTQPLANERKGHLHRNDTILNKKVPSCQRMQIMSQVRNTRNTLSSVVRDTRTTPSSIVPWHPQDSLLCGSVTPALPRLVWFRNIPYYSL